MVGDSLLGLTAALMLLMAFLLLWRGDLDDAPPATSKDGAGA